MTTKEIEIKGKKYPVAFTMKTMQAFETITEKGFFSANLELFTSRIALILAANLTADEKTDLTVDTLIGEQSWQDTKEIIGAYNIIMSLANDFFEVPKLAKGKETETENKENNPKN